MAASASNLRPTPAQARVLRLLRDNPESCVRVWFSAVDLVKNSDVEDHERYWPHGVSQTGHVHRSSVLVAVRVGWLVRRVTMAGRWRLGGEASFYDLTDLGRHLLDSLPPEAFISKVRPKPASKRGEAGRVLQALAGRHDYGNGWLFFVEAPIDHTGHAHHIDAFAMNCFRSHGYRRVGYEVKVSRGDFLGELKKPQKTKQSAWFCTAFYFACPEGLIKPSEVPDPYGLVIVKPNGKAFVTKKSVIPEPVAPTWGFLARMLRRDGEL